MARKKLQWFMRGSWWRRIRLNRKYRDRLFRFLFRDKKDLLDLYNALNGTDLMEDEAVLYLSDSFAGGHGSGCLECRCRVLNINRGHNKAVVGRCRRLWEYAEFLSEVNEWIAKGKPREEAIQLAMDFCIDHDILREILIRQRAEVLHMLLTEFDEKKYKRTIYSEGYEDGELAGFSKGELVGFSKGELAGFSKGELAGFDKRLRMQIQKKLQNGKSARQIADELEEDLSVIQEIIEKTGQK